jgi:hypothetical protein
MTPSSLAAVGHWCVWLGVLAVSWNVLPAAATAQDVVTVVVPSANARSGSALSTFGYDPTGANGGTIYSAGFGSGGEIRRITNVDGEQSVTTLVAQTEWTTFLKGGDPTNGNGQPTPNGFLLNPRAIGGKAAYSSIVVADGGSVVTVSSAKRNDLTQRLYTYDLTSGSFSSLVTQAEFATAAGLASGTAADTTTASRVNAESGTSGVSCAPPPGTGVQAAIVAWYSASPISTCETTGAVEGVSRKSCDAASPPLTSARFV